MGYTMQRWGTRPILKLILLLGSTAQILGQSQLQKEKISASYEISKINQLIINFEKEYHNKKQTFKSVSEANQWEQNIKELDGTVVALNDIGTDGTPLYYTTYMDPTSKVSRANALHENGSLNLELSGAGMQVGVWDAGVALNTHQEFDDRVLHADASFEIDSHTTMVTGTLVSSGVQDRAKGVAYEAQALTHNWTRDKIEVAAAAANGLLLSNHSYGIKTDRVPDWYFGSYIKVSQDWDKIMYNAPYYLMVTAAGNAHNSLDNESPVYGKTEDGFDLLVGFTTAKNGLVIAAANTEINNNGELKNATVSGYSSFGPTDDGRIKPDLAGDGTTIYSTSAANNQSYDSTSGTSMATPGVTGALLLLQQYYESLTGTFMKASTLKGLALHTADDVNERGPDYKMGWGVINVQTAAELIKHQDFTSILSEEILEDGSEFTMTVNADNYQTLSASISWTDPEGIYINQGEMNATKAALINDLDIRIIQNDRTYLPWKLNPEQANAKAIKGDNTVDPFERIDIPNAQGTYTIVISHKNVLTKGQQNFSVIVSGATLSECQLETPKGLAIDSSDENSTLLTWPNSNDTLYEIQYKADDEDEWMTIFTDDANTRLLTLEKGEKYTAKLRSICTQNLSSEFSEEIQFTFNGVETQLSGNDPIEYSQEVKMSVYPNPAVNQLSIETKFSPDAVYSVRTTGGFVVKAGKIRGSINVADLATGLYILTVQDYGGIKSTKFFKS
ncbi:MAG: S8 family serine peptidase [Croceitalea sp.]|nr:S8 family serine peptidase [Croceitalea sp.]